MGENEPTEAHNRHIFGYIGTVLGASTVAYPDYLYISARSSQPIEIVGVLAATVIGAISGYIVLSPFDGHGL